MARSEYAAYTLLDEPLAAQECLNQLLSFMTENDLTNRDLLLEINSQSNVKRLDIVDGFHRIASDITDAFRQLDASTSHLHDNDRASLQEGMSETDDPNDPAKD